MAKAPPTIANKLVKPPRGALQAAAAKEDDQNNKLSAFIQEKDRMAAPAYYVDKTHITYWANHVRLSFGEAGPNTGTYWRSAVIMEAEDARRFLKRLSRILDELEREEPEPESDQDADA